MNKRNNSFKILFVDMSKQYKEWNKHSIWLLIATIGCWGISNIIIQAFAMLLIFIITMSQFHSLEIQIKEQKTVKLNLIKEMYGRHFTDSRVKLFKRKMWQFAIQQLWISALCMVFVFVSIFLIGFQLGIIGINWVMG